MARILVAEDDENLRAGIEEMLREEGYEVESVSNGEEALERIRQGNYDVLLTDLVMPKMNGMELLTEVKKLKPEVKVIIITAFATIESAVEAIKKGASDYIEKPFKINEVQNTIKRVLEEAKFERERRMGTGIRYEVIKAVSNPLRRRVLEFLYPRGRTHFRDIRTSLGISEPAKLSFHLKILKQAKLIDQDEERRYFITDSGRKTLEILGRGEEE